MDAETKAGYTPLHIASHFGQVSMVRTLHDHGADVNKVTEIGYTPLHQASQQGHATIAQLLLQKGASPNAVTAVSITTKIFIDALIVIITAAALPQSNSN